MSHFSKIRTQLKEKDLTMKALRDLGLNFEEGEGLEVQGFTRQKMPVEIKINLPHSYAIGLRRNGENFEVVADWFGVKGIKKDEFTQQLNQRYAYHAAREKLEAQGFNLVEEKQEETGQIRLVLRRME